MLLLPIVLLITTAILIWLLRKRHLRSHWFLASFSILLAWMAIYLLRDQLPNELEFSIWEPQALFSAPLLFTMDEVTWPLLITCLAISLVISLTLPSRDILVTVRERLTFIIYLCLTLAAILAGNMLSVVTTWMLMDVFIFVLGMRGTEHENDEYDIVRWLAKNLISIFLLLIAVVLDISMGGSLNFREQMIGASIVIVIISSFLRMPVISLSTYGKHIGWNDTGNISALDIFPALSGFSVLGHVFENGIASDVIPWVSLIGALFLVYSVIHTYLWIKIKDPWIILYMGIFGIGIMAASYGDSEAGILIAAIGVLTASLNTTFVHLPIHETWHTVVPVLFIGMVAGLPGTPGGLLGSRTINEITNSGLVGIGMIVWIGTALITSSYLKNANLFPQEWKNSENLTRISYAMGALFLVVNAIFIGIEIKSDVSVTDLLFFVSVAFIAGLMYYGMNKVSQHMRQDPAERIRIPRMKSEFNILKTVAQIPLGVLSGVGRIFESETGMLWAFVILQLLILVIGNFGT